MLPLTTGLASQGKQGEEKVWSVSRPKERPILLTYGSVQKVGGLGRKRYDRLGHCRPGDRGWGGFCGWSKRRLIAPDRVSTSWRSCRPATLAISRIWG